MEHVVWLERPQVRTPVVVAAFTGWNDAGDAATLAVRHLTRVWQARPFAHVDPEEFFDFQATRPQVQLAEGLAREIVWPGNELSAAATPGGDVVFLLGTEPNLRWRTFTGAVVEVAQELGARLVVTLGALLADVPHSRPVSIIGTGTDQALIDRFDLHRSRYEGPTGIVGVLHDACQRAGLPSLSLWAAVPAYVSGTTSPKAALALVVRSAAILGAPADVSDLADATTGYEREIDAAVRGDDDLAAYVERLERLADDGDDEDDDEEDAPAVAGDAHPAGGDGGTASAARLVEEVERFLRDQGPPRSD